MSDSLRMRLRAFLLVRRRRFLYLLDDKQEREQEAWLFALEGPEGESFRAAVVRAEQQLAQLARAAGWFRGRVGPVAGVGKKRGRQNRAWKLAVPTLVETGVIRRSMVSAYSWRSATMPVWQQAAD